MSVFLFHGFHGVISFFLLFRRLTTSQVCSPFLAGSPDIVSLCLLAPWLSTKHPAFPSDLGWLYGDVIAGFTVGVVAVPQSMSYAQVRSRHHIMIFLRIHDTVLQIATLPPQYGLYSTFVGTLVYCVGPTRPKNA